MSPSQPFPASDALTVSAAYTRLIANTLGLQARELPALLEGTGLKARDLLPGTEVSVHDDQLIRLLANGDQLYGRPGFGFAVGHQMSPDVHGPIGYLSLSSANVLASLEALAEYLPVRMRIGLLRIDADERWLDVTFETALRAPGAILRILAETFALAMQAQVEAILQREAREARIAFAHRAPAYAALYGQTLHGTVTFSAPVMRYRLPIELAYVRNPNGDGEAFRLLQARCAAMLARRDHAPGDVAARVRHLLLEQPPGSIDEGAVAAALFMSTRTLSRRLSAEGTGYRRIRDDVTRELAIQALTASDESMEAIAASLGYNDSAALRKAVRRWTGCSPTALRASGKR